MKLYLTAIYAIITLSISAQSISGTVLNSLNEPLIGANIYWQATSSGDQSDANGSFTLPVTDNSNKNLIASFVGYAPDTIDVTNLESVEFFLQELDLLGEVVVKGQRDGVVISNLKAIKTEQITQTELAKSACCDLAGCFGTQSSVQPQTTNVITNSKELRILGLSGVYNQVLIDGFPMIQGLSYTYGISGIPGTLVDNIFVAKGANSVLQGYESISGQINVQTKDPDPSERFLLNGYINSFGEKHVNANYSFDVGSWSSIVAAHSVQPADRIDGDEDAFLDVPLLTRYMVYNKWKYGNEGDWGWHSEIGARFLNEDRVGGQVAYDPDVHKGGDQVYGQSVKLNQPELWTKTGFRYDDIHAVNFFLSGYHQDQDTYFGPVRYDAQQTNLYANAQYERNYGNHNIKTGISLRYLDISEDISFTKPIVDRSYDGLYQRSETIPGVFAENTMSWLDNRFTWIGGVRVDHHNQYGTYVTPRILLKYDLSSQSTVRVNVGTGWRTVNLFSENINLLASSRDVIFAEDLLPEEATNVGINYIQKFESNSLSGYLSTDFYHTNFQNQIFPDYDTDPTQAIIQNYTGTSIGNGFQAELNLKFEQQVELKVGYNYLDVYREEGDAKVLLPFNSKHKWLSVLSFKPTTNQYHIDINAHWYGQQRLPNTSANPAEFQRPDFSDAYAVVGAQFTYNFKSIQVYTGVENIFDFRQERPILSWENPFGPYFDTSSVWGPTRGRELYIGFRYYMREEGK